MSTDEIIKRYDLKPHPEGGYFRETYRSEYCTEAFFFMPAGSRSIFHMIPSDETWHFYFGGPITIAIIHSDGKVEKTTLGQDINSGQKIQHTIPANTWFGAYPDKGTEYALVGCTVAPPFNFKTLKIAKRDELLRSFSGAKDIIERLTYQGG